MPTALLSIARNTFTESIRQPIFVVMLILVSLLLVLNLFLSGFTLDDDNKMLIDMGLSMTLLGGLFLAAFSATGVVSREIENKTVLTVISKPIARPVFILGKYLGVSGAITLAFWIWSLVFLLTVRHKVMTAASDDIDLPVVVFGFGSAAITMLLALWGNYFYNWVFPSTVSVTLAALLPIGYLFVLLFDKQFQFQPITAEFTNWETTNYGEDAKRLDQIMLGQALLLPALWLLCAVAVATATRLGQVMTLAICAAVLMLGLISDSFFGRYAETNWLAGLLYSIVPNMQLFFTADAITQNKVIPGSYVGMTVGYAVAYIAALLGIAVALFQTRETG